MAPEVTAPRLRRRRLVLVALVLVAVGLAAAVTGVLLVHRAHQAREELELARAEVDQLRDQLHAGNTAGVDALVAQIKEHAGAAHGDTSGALWTLGSWLPVEGRSLHAAHEIAAIVDDLSKHELPGLAASVTSIAPKQLRQADGQLNLAAITSAQVQVDDAVPALAKAIVRLAKVPRTHVDRRLNTAHDELTKSLATLSDDLAGAHRGLSVLVPMLGSTGVRTYFVALQNPAEARGTGGLVGAYAIVTVDHGKVTLVHAGSDAELNTEAAQTPIHVAGLPAEFTARWGDVYPTGSWLSSNVSPHMPWTASIWAAKYTSQFGTKVDAVLALDPQALTELLGPTGTVPLPDGSTLASNDIPMYVESTLYAKFPDTSAGEGNSPERKAYLVALFKGAVDQLVHEPLPSSLLDGLRAGAAQGHIQIWSAVPAEEADLVTTEVGGSMPDTPGPFAWLYLLNTTNNKGDVWIDRALDYTTGPCPADPHATGATRVSTVTATLTNNLPDGQPPSVTKRDDLHDPVPYGETAELFAVYLPVGAEPIDASVDGVSQPLEGAQERDHLVVTFPLELPREHPQTVIVHFKEPALGTPSSWRPQPLARTETDTRHVTQCG